MEKKISIIVPAFNAEEYLERCAETLLKQTIGLASLEIILVNDASTDGTLGIMKKIEQAHPEEVLVIDLKENMRQGGARNVGLSYASGEYIGFVDADDWADYTMYEKLYEKAKAYDCDIVYCRHVRDRGEDTLTDLRTGKEDQLLQITNEGKRQEFLLFQPIGVGVWDKIYKRTLLLENEIVFPEHLAYEDIYFGTMVYFYAERVYLLEERLYHYYVNSDSTVLKKGQTYYKDFFQVNQQLWAQMQARGFLEKYTEVLEFDYIMSYYIAGMKLLVLRFEGDICQEIRKMQAHIRENLKTYPNNPYIKQYASELYQLAIGMIDQELSDAQIREMAKVMKQHFK